MIATLLLVIPMAVSQFLFAEGAHFEDDLELNVRRFYKFIFLLLITAFVLLLLLGRWLLLLFGASILRAYNNHCLSRVKCDGWVTASGKQIVVLS